MPIRFFVNHQIFFLIALIFLAKLSCAVTEENIHFCGRGLHASEASRLHDLNTEALRWGTQSATIVTWSFLNANKTNIKNSVNILVEPVIGGLNGFPNNAQELVCQAFDQWQRSADISFMELTDGTEGKILIGTHSLSTQILGHGFFPGEGLDIAGDVHFQINRNNWDERKFKSVAIHEIGHAISLKHIGNNNTVPDIIMHPQDSPQNLM